MAVRKGLGRGLDSMFPRYTEKESVPKEKESSSSKETGKEKREQNKKSVKKAAAAAAKEEIPAEEVQTAEPQKQETGKEKESPSQAGPLMVKLSKIEPNAAQPRKDFDEDALLELSESIRQVGMIQPIVVQKRDNYYEIIAGERRWRAARMAGLKEVPVIVKELTEKEILELSLIENLQREDLNAIEAAKAYKRLLEEFELTQDELAERVSKSRTAITNTLRLLKLSDKVQEMLITDMISAGHARALLAIENPVLQETAAQQVFDEKLSVRETEKLVKMYLRPKPEGKKPSGPDEATKLIYHDMEDRLRDVLGTKVTVHYGSGQKGKLEIEYYSSDELERIYDLIRFGTKG